MIIELPVIDHKNPNGLVRKGGRRKVEQNKTTYERKDSFELHHIYGTTTGGS